MLVSYYILYMLRLEYTLEIRVWSPVNVLYRESGSIDLKFMMCNHMLFVQYFEYFIYLTYAFPH